MDDQEKGKDLAFRFLEMCQNEGATGTALLNAIGNALVGYFMTTDFRNRRERMQEVEHWCAHLRKEITTAENLK